MLLAEFLSKLVTRINNGCVHVSDMAALHGTPWMSIKSLPGQGMHQMQTTSARADMLP